MLRQDIPTFCRYKYRHLMSQGADIPTRRGQDEINSNSDQECKAREAQ
jgi:hypothetical protein